MIVTSGEEAIFRSSIRSLDVQRSLRSSSQSLLQVPRVKTDFGRRAFSSAAAQIWNHIPAASKVSPSLDTF